MTTGSSSNGGIQCLLYNHVTGPKLSGYPTSTATRATVIQNSAVGFLRSVMSRLSGGGVLYQSNITPPARDAIGIDDQVRSVCHSQLSVPTYHGLGRLRIQRRCTKW